MIPYAEYELNDRQLKVLTKMKVRRAIQKYIKENGHEPSQEEIDAFAVLSEEDIEWFKRCCYSAFVTRNVNGQNPPQPQEDKLEWVYCVSNGKPCVKGVLGEQVLYEWLDDVEKEQTKSFYGSECWFVIEEGVKPVEVTDGVFVGAIREGYVNFTTGERYEFDEDILIFLSNNGSRTLRKDAYDYTVYKWFNSFVVKVDRKNGVAYDYDGNILSDTIPWDAVQFAEDASFHRYFIDALEWYSIEGFGETIEESLYTYPNFSIELGYMNYKKQDTNKHWVICRFLLPEEYENKRKRLIGITNVERVSGSNAEEVAFEVFTIDGEHVQFTYRLRYEGLIDSWGSSETTLPEHEEDEHVFSYSKGYTIYKLLRITTLPS